MYSIEIQNEEVKQLLEDTLQQIEEKTGEMYTLTLKSYETCKQLKVGKTRRSKVQMESNNVGQAEEVRGRTENLLEWQEFKGRTSI